MRVWDVYSLIGKCRGQTELMSGINSVAAVPPLLALEQLQDGASL